MTKWRHIQGLLKQIPDWEAHLCRRTADRVAHDLAHLFFPLLHILLQTYFSISLQFAGRMLAGSSTETEPTERIIREVMLEEHEGLIHTTN